MADVIIVEEFDQCSEETNKSDCDSDEIIITVDTDSPLLNNIDEEPSNETDKTNTDMTLKPEVSEPEILASEDPNINPTELLPPVERLEKYANSELVFNRQVVACKLLETLRVVHENPEDVERVVRVLSFISEDYDPTVRLELMVQLPHIAAFCKEVKLNHIIVNCLEPMLLSYLGDEESAHVRKSCYSALISIIEQGLFEYERYSKSICQMVLCLTESLHPEDYRTESIALIGKLVVLMGKKAAEEIFFERLFALCEDKVNNVRKACALIFGDICQTVGEETTEEVLLPKFFALCEDTAWGVRKACAEIFMTVSFVVSREKRCKELANIYLMLLSDHSRWVRLTAYQCLGAFISTFYEPKRTGLFFKDGVITIDDSICSKLDTSDLPKCNGDIGSPDAAADHHHHDSSLDRTNSSIPCDSVVPLLCTDNNHSASQVPGIPCHVGNCRAAVIRGDSGCDSGGLSSGESEHARWLRVDGESLGEKEFLSMWTEALYGDEAPKNGEVEGCSKEAFLNALGPINGEVVHDGENSNGEGALEQLSNGGVFEAPTDDAMEIDTECSIPTLTFCAQELIGANVDSSSSSESSGEPAVLKVSSADDSCGGESAFNHFQYWRDPLPEIDIAAALEGLNLSPDNSIKYHHRSDVLVGPGKDRRMRIAADMPPCSGEPPPTTNLCPYDQDIVPPELLSQYLSMIDSSWAQTIDVEIARHCAYSLPAVALTLGRQFWSCLKDTFDALSSDLQGFIMMWKVRRTIASAMHELAVILGPEITSRDLLPVFSRFINDLDEVRVGILQHLYDFLKVLRPEERLQFLPTLRDFLISNSDSDANEKNWRFRLILAEQLVSISELYDPNYIRDHLVPLTITLLTDKVCEVRLAAVRVVASVMKQLSQSPNVSHSQYLLQVLTENFVHSPKWLYRQLYVYVCQEFISEKSLSPDQFAEDALPQLLYLCWDRVPNVRIAIARCLVTVIWPVDNFSNPTSPHRELLLQTIHTLQSDMDADVRFYANRVSTHECSCLQNGDFSNVVEPFV